MPQVLCGQLFGDCRISREEGPSDMFRQNVSVFIVESPRCFIKKGEHVAEAFRDLNIRQRSFLRHNF